MQHIVWAHFQVKALWVFAGIVAVLHKALLCGVFRSWKVKPLYCRVRSPPQINVTALSKVSNMFDSEICLFSESQYSIVGSNNKIFRYDFNSPSHMKINKVGVLKNNFYISFYKNNK